MNPSNRWLVCLVLFGGSVCAAQEAGASGKEKVADREASQQQAQLNQRLQMELSPQSPGSDPQQTQRRLQQIIQDAAHLADSSDNAQIKFQCYSLQLQAVQSLIQRWPADPETDRRLADLRLLARLTKALPRSDGLALGDYWLLQAELFELNRSELTDDEKRRQSEQVLRSFILVHERGPAVDAARKAMQGFLSGVKPAAALNPPAEPPAGPAAEASKNSRIGDDSPFTLGKPTLNRDGITEISIRCKYQRGENLLRILAPVPPPGAKPPQAGQYLIVLPVEPGLGAQFGDPMTAIKKLDLSQKHNLVVVMPTLSDMPWYADHPHDANLQQESYLTKAVLPAIRSLYPSDEPHYYLLGFSKSGWGAVSLLCRNLNKFDAAAVWDAPLMLDTPDQFEMDKVFVTKTYFSRYYLPEQVRNSSRQLRKDKRIFLLGHDYYPDHLQRFHQVLDELKVPHDYDNNVRFQHRWDSGWLSVAVDRLFPTAAPK